MPFDNTFLFFEITMAIIPRLKLEIGGTEERQQAGRQAGSFLRGKKATISGDRPPPVSVCTDTLPFFTVKYRRCFRSIEFPRCLWPTLPSAFFTPATSLPEFSTSHERLIKIWCISAISHWPRSYLSLWWEYWAVVRFFFPNFWTVILKKYSNLSFLFAIMNKTMGWLRFFELYLSMTVNYRIDFENIYNICNNLILVIIELVIVLYKY